MEGLEISVLLKSELEVDNLTKRFDSEYLQKRYLNNLNVLKNYKKGVQKLKYFIEHMSGGATPLGAEYGSEGILFLRVQNIMQNYFSLNDVVYLNKKQDEEIKRSRLKKEDVLLTITGVSYGKSAVVPQNLAAANINQHSVKITLNKKINPYFLSTFLNSKFGKLQSDKNIVGVTRPALDYEVIKNILIATVSKEIQAAIQHILLESETKTNKSQSLFSEAENLVLKGSGLYKFRPSHQSANIKSFKTSFMQMGRIDAEFYQKKFDDLEYLIMKTGNGTKLGSLLSANKRGTQPVYNEEGHGIPVLNSKHIRENRIDFLNNRFGDPSETKADIIIRKSDLLINGTGVGTIGRCAVYMKDEPALPDNHVTVLRTEGIDPIFLAVMLNSIIGKMQVEKYFKGSSGQIELYPNDINEFIIWKAPESLQKEVRDRIEEAENLRNQSIHLLDVAKKAVEMAIDRDEVTALNFIKQNTI